LRAECQTFKTKTLNYLHKILYKPAADVGFIAYSLALAPILAKEGKYLLFPASAHKEIVQAYVLLKPASNNQTAKRFEAFVGSQQARTIFKRYGFKLPNE